MPRRPRSSWIGSFPQHQRLLWGPFVVGLGVLVFPRDAHAYLDAGTGSMILQALVASAAAGMVLARRYRAKIRAFLRRRPPEPSGDPAVRDS